MFSIAATLLVLEIAIPEADFEDLWRDALFRRTAYADGVLVRLNLLLLMVVAFLPFPTRLVAEAITRTSAERAAVLFYGATLFIVSLLFTAMGGYLVVNHDLLAADGRSDVKVLVGRLAPSLGFYAAILLFALVAPNVGAFGFLAVAVNAVVRA